MNKTIILATCFLSLVSLWACCKCETEPIVEQNHKLVVPPNFGKMPE
ncbi:MAG: hypothetical protein LBT45_02045 [Rickettsiales bacterium]|jgi:hypothetical protein|nr:hypothetical protein [Rickettsiales bacterium]